MSKTPVASQDEFASPRAFKSSLAFGLTIATLLFTCGQTRWGWGYVVGALLSLFSLFTIAVLVPMLFQPNGNPFAKMLLGVTLFMKLPIYMIALYLVTRVPFFAPLGAFAGIGLVPMVLTLKAIRAHLEETGRLPRLADTRFHALGNETVSERTSTTTAGLEPVPERG